jgi:hypothetical protein
MPAALFTLALAACTSPPIAPDVPHVVERLVLLPYATHEACAQMRPGDRLDWRYESSTPLAFDLRYREGNAVLAPIVRSDSTADSGTYEARLAASYCLGFEAGPGGAIVSYRMLLRSPVR